MSDSEEDDSPRILAIDKREVANDSVMELIYADTSRDYYASRDWSADFYLLQAIRGFIAVGHRFANGEQILLPEMQKSYCVFDWENIDKNKSILRDIRRKLSQYRIRINSQPAAVLKKLKEYHRDKSWLCDRYEELCRSLFASEVLSVEHFPKVRDCTIFRFCSIELYDLDGSLAAGELGYVIGSTFTSLSGFCRREKSVSLGKVHILSLAKSLENNGFAFFNLGQPPREGHMQYKTDLGGKEVCRSAFLERWREGIRRPPTGLENFLHTFRF
jgi:hypothetical protein